MEQRCYQQNMMMMLLMLMVVGVLASPTTDASSNEALVAMRRLSQTLHRHVNKMDPVLIPAVPIDWNSAGCFAHGYLNATRLTGLKLADLQLTRFDPDTFSLAVAIEVPSLKADGSMSLEMSVCGWGQLTSGREASFAVTLRNVSLAVEANFTIDQQQLVADYFDLSVDFEEWDVDVLGLLTNRSLEQTLLEVARSPYGVKLFRALKPICRDSVLRRMRTRLNSFLANADLFNMARSNRP